MYKSIVNTQQSIVLRENVHPTIFCVSNLMLRLRLRLCLKIFNQFITNIPNFFIKYFQRTCKNLIY